MHFTIPRPLLARAAARVYGLGKLLRLEAVGNTVQVAATNSVAGARYCIGPSALGSPVKSSGRATVDANKFLTLLSGRHLKHSSHVEVWANDCKLTIDPADRSSSTWLNIATEGDEECDQPTFPTGFLAAWAVRLYFTPEELSLILGRVSFAASGSKRSSDPYSNVAIEIKDKLLRMACGDRKQWAQIIMPVAPMADESSPQADVSLSECFVPLGLLRTWVKDSDSQITLVFSQDNLLGFASGPFEAWTKTQQLEEGDSGDNGDSASSPAVLLKKKRKNALSTNARDFALELEKLVGMTDANAEHRPSCVDLTVSGDKLRIEIDDLGGGEAELDVEYVGSTTPLAFCCDGRRLLAWLRSCGNGEVRLEISDEDREGRLLVGRSGDQGVWMMRGYK